MAEDKQVKIELIPQQADFVTSEHRFPHFIGGIGTGKTYCLLLKCVRYAQTYPGSVCMIVRKTFTDLHDSTLADFTEYFGLTVDQHKEVKFENGSRIMFRHGSEIEVLKNINLDWCGIEQAEEFEDDTQFNFLRDRMRGKHGPYQQIALISNCNGHNWCWRMWVNNPSSEDFHLITATTFDNAKNLPAKFIEDQKAREKDSPRHFRRMVMNDFSEDLADDNVFRSSDIIRSSQLGFTLPKFVNYAAGLDVGRYGTDASCLTILAQVGPKKWKQVFMEEKQGWGAPAIVGWVKDMWQKFPFSTLGVDDIGVGGGCKDYLNDSSKFTTYGFIANEKPNGESVYPNKKSEGMFRLEEYISKEWLEILPDIYLHEEFMTVKYYYRGESIKYIVSKDELRSKGIKSYNKVDALMIALYYADEKDSFDWDDIVVPGVVPSKKPLQQFAITDLVNP
jgi:hypothetical protein